MRIDIGFKHFTELQWFSVVAIANLPLMLLAIACGVRPPGWPLPLAANILLALIVLLFVEFPGRDGFKSVESAGDGDRSRSVGVKGKPNE